MTVTSVLTLTSVVTVTILVNKNSLLKGYDLKQMEFFGSIIICSLSVVSLF